MWDELIGQEAAIATLKNAVADEKSLAHSWLISGPPGSGRSNLAYAFAWALLGGDDSTAALVKARTHPDLSYLATEGINISIEDVRRLVQSAYLSPSLAQWRVIVVEDADRMTERTSNVLLKALEEPPARTIWILCAPTDADLLPTIRSRVRTLRLKTPDEDDVVRLLMNREGVTEELARTSAREAQNHVGMARRLATDDAARGRRDQIIRDILNLRSPIEAPRIAAGWLQLANEDAESLSSEQQESEREKIRHSLGLDDTESTNRALAAQVKQYEADAKRRESRNLRDALDRILVDISSLFRDMVMVSSNSGAELINERYRREIISHTERKDLRHWISATDSITIARKRLESNVQALLVLESLIIETAV
ncbi:MAG: DNA polymerase III subunit delta' [Microbacteriaceae bacterium]|nr:DNA polymerase III subunit delta' [Microbacteriaceae bacterium]